MIGSITVLYNPCEPVFNNIKSYLPFVDKVYIIDNSDVPNSSVLAFQDEEKIVCIANYGNLGVAAALNIACKLAYESGVRWILTMDQDSSFMDFKHFLEIANFNAFVKVGIFAASYLEGPDNDNYKEQKNVITSGNLLNLEAWDMIGGFDEKLFIDEVDNDFCARLRQNGFKIFITERKFLHHKLGEDFWVYDRIRGRKKKLTRHSPFRLYYITRNGLFIIFKYLFSDMPFVLNRIKNLLSLYYQIFRFYPSKKKYFYYGILGVRHFLAGRYGKL